MAKIKLKKADIERVVEALVNKHIEPRQKEYDRRQQANGDAIWSAIYGEHARAMNKMPDWFFISSPAVTFLYNAKGSTHHESVPMSKTRLVVQNYNVGHEPLKASDPLVVEYLALRTERQAIYKDRVDTTDKLQRSLTAFKTVDALLAAWPELKKDLPELIKELTTVGPSLPALRIDDVKDLLSTLAKAA